MKKIYVCPKSRSIEVDLAGIIAGSGGTWTENGSGTGGSIGGSGAGEQAGGEAGAGGYRTNLWD